MNLYEINEKLKKSRRAVFTINEVKKYTGLSGSVARVYIHRMVKKGILYKVERNKYANSKNIFVIASQLAEPCYISFMSGLYLHQLLDQIVNIAQVVLPRHKKSFNSFQFVQFTPKRFFGYRWVKYENSYINLGELEKILLDMLYLPRYGRIVYVYNALENCDIKKLIAYAKRMGSEAVTKRLGYLLELRGYKTDLWKGLRNKHKLNPLIKRKGTFDSKWKLWVNEAIK